MLQRPLEAPIVYNRNHWGTVESMDYAGTNYPIFGSRNDLNWSLSNGVNLTLNDWGQLITVAKQGLAAKTISYDGQGRLKDIKIGETVETVVTYDGAVVDTVDHAGVTETYNRDEMGRVTSVTVNDTMVAKAGDTNGTWTYKDDGSGRVATYLDRNGALQRYDYDKAGRLTEIAIEHGPTLRYAYNKYGQLATVQSGDLRADFSNYDKGVPGTITWGNPAGGDPDAAVQTFTVTKNLEGRIDRIESSDGAFLLDLDWTQATDGSGSWLIDRVEKQADGFGEVWAPTYSADKRLDAITITRSTGQVIAETYNVDANRLLGGLTRVVDGVTVLDATSGINWTGTYSSDKGNLTQLADGLGNQMDLTYDARRRISSVTHAVPGGNLTYDYLYDLENRRLRADVPVDNSGTWTTTERVYAFQGSRIIAIGDMDASSTITWTHAIGWGPLGPVFIDDLTSAGNDYYLFTDHLGTPFGHHNPTTDTTYHTPTNPWGELLATHPAPAPHYAAQGTVATNSFTLPPDATHTTSPLGLAGHLYDHHTGLVYMHNRHYHPRLGHFTTPDYRAPDIYDPTTYTEPYAYAGGNPVMAWDPDGLAEVIDVGSGRIRVYGIDPTGQEVFLELSAIAWQKIIRGKAGFYSPLYRFLDEDGQIRPEFIHFSPYDFADLRGSNQAIYNERANLILAQVFGYGTRVKASNGEITELIVNITLDSSFIVFGGATALGKLGSKAFFLLSGSGVAGDLGFQFAVEGRSINELDLLQATKTGTLTALGGHFVGAGWSSSNIWLSTGTKTLGAVGSGFGIYQGVSTAYSGYQEDDFLKVTYGAGGIVLSYVGFYKSSSALYYNPNRTISGLPQGVSKEQFGDMVQVLRRQELDGVLDIRAHGSRVSRTARPDSDIDIAIRVDKDQFNLLIDQRFQNVNLGSAKMRTMIHAIWEGKITTGDAGLRKLKKELSKILGRKVDVSIIKQGGNFDQGPWMILVH